MMRELLARLSDWWHSFTIGQTPPPPPQYTSRGPAAPDMLAPPPMVGDDTLRDWMVHHHRHDANVWQSVVSKFYATAAADEEIRAYFDGVDMDRLQNHFLRQLVIITHIGLTVRAADSLGQRHAHLGITGPVFDRVRDVLVNTLTDFGVPRTAVLQLAQKDGIVEVLRRRLVTVP